MNFRNRYLLWIIFVPTALAFATAFILLSQTLQLSKREWAIAAAIWLVVHTIANILLARRTAPLTSTLERNGLPTDQASETLSQLHMVTSSDSNYVWLGGGVIFSIVAAMLVVPTGLGFTFFLVSSFVAGIVADIFIYGSLKRLLIGEALRYEGVYYTGKEIPIARKMGVVFVGIFFAGAATIVLLVTARVSGSLERLALSAAHTSFEQSTEKAASAGEIDGAELTAIERSIPAEYELFLLTASGEVLQGESSSIALDADEVAQARARRNGDSSAFVASHVFHFRTLPNGSILVMKVPFEAFSAIPRQVALYVTVVSILTAFFFALATYYLSKDISSPLRKVKRLAAAMAEGDFEQAPKIFTDDETSTLAQSFAASRRNLLDLLRRIGSSGSSIAGGVKVISSGADTLVSAAAEQSALTRRSSEAVESVKHGAELVLNAAHTVTAGATDTSSRAVELHASAEEVARSMDVLSESVDKISSSILQMKAAAEETSSRTDLLANIGEEVLTFVTEMDSTVTELQRNANASADIASDVRKTAVTGTEEVQRSLESSQVANGATTRASQVIHDLTNRIAHISQIVSVIEDIAGRTNLLSLNAAIIAAQAGDQGAGFSVVADEIRELAERTRKSTTEISGIVRAVQQGSREAVRAIEEGVDRVNENLNLASQASKSLGRIAAIAEESNTMARHMAEALGQQAVASTHLRTAASTMSEHIHEINRSMREQAQGAGLLAGETERVRDIATHVKRSTDQQSFAARGITVAMEDIVGDVSTIRDHLQQQLDETESILSAATKILAIAESNDAIARQFSTTVDSLLESGRTFEGEVARFRLTTS